MSVIEIVTFLIFAILACTWIITVTIDQFKVNKDYRKALETITEKLPGIEFALSNIDNKLSR